MSSRVKQARAARLHSLLQTLRSLHWDSEAVTQESRLAHRHLTFN